MEKNSKFSTKTLISLALLTAISIILARFCVIWITPSIRISFGNIPILLAGIMFGPIGGALVGLVSDVLGSAFLSGLGWYPPITISAMLMGLIPGLLKPLVLKEFSIFRIFTVDFAANVVASMCWTTFWLDQLYGSGFLALLSVRVPLYIGISVLETVILFAVCRTSVFHAAGVRMIGEKKT